MFNKKQNMDCNNRLGSYCLQYGVHHRGCSPFFVLFLEYMFCNVIQYEEKRQKGRKIQMKVNGKEKELKEQMNLKEFLECEGYIVNHVAIEYNGMIIRKNELENIVLKEYDQIEIVHFVGGGC